MKVAVIGAGAAGVFAAIAIKANYTNAEVIIFEKSQKLLAKVKVSGGGRCNVTNATTSISELVKAYPRGGNRLKKPFSIFNTVHTRQWFEERGVRLKAEDDRRVFPVTNNSQTIIDCLLTEASNKDIKIRTGIGISKIEPVKDGFELITIKEPEHKLYFNKVIVATGGSPKVEGFNWLKNLGHEIINPVPSLFTFNMPGAAITKLMGVVVQNTLVSVQGTKLKESGPLLITHWGFSGPAILKLSAYGARYLSEKNYSFKVQVNWVNESNNEVVMKDLTEVSQVNAKKIVRNYRPYGLPEKLWHFLLDKANINLEARWGELGKKGLNKLVNLLTNDIYAVAGKTTFKEEFVTCGGVSLDSIDMKTMQSKVCPNLYFAGEVMDIDAITGGYNFQAAWTTGFIAGKLL